MPKITVDGIDYNTEDLSDNGKAQLASLQFLDVQLSKIQGEIAVYQTARNSYVAALKAELEKQGWQLDPVLDPRMGLFFRSDNAPFAMLDASNEDIKKAFQNKKKAVVKGIPMHAISVWRGQPHYHQPNDDASIIHIPNLVSLAESLGKAFHALPSNTKIEWLENEQFQFSRPN